MTEKVAVFVAHPDDAEILMAGTMAKMIKTGYEVNIIVSSIPTSRKIRIAEMNAASNILGTKCQYIDKKGTWRVEDIKNHELVAEFEKYIQNLRPKYIFTHWNRDLHYDHKLVSQGVLAASRRQQMNLYMCGPVNFYTPLEASFGANSFSDITDYYETSIEAVRVFRSQVQKANYEKQIDVRTAFYGLQAGCKRADGFMCIKQLMNL